VSRLTSWLALAVALFLLLPSASKAQVSPPDAPLQPPAPGSLRTMRQPPLTQDEEVPAAAMPGSVPEDSGVMLDGQMRYGAFLSGPGSLTFLLHHSILGAMGGFITQALPRSFSFDKSSREAMLAGTLIGGGLGFASSAWWQFNHWMDKPVGYFGIANSVIGGMFVGGFMDMLTKDPTLITWSAVVGAELGAWLTAGIAGGQMSTDDGLMVASGGGWGLAYSALLLAIIHFSGTPLQGKTFADVLLIAPGVGATVMALATMKYEPTTRQILRANAYGAGIGALVLLISGLVLGGFDQPTPYVLSAIGSAGAIATVSVLWEEAAERPGGSYKKQKQPYRGLW
jgi:hypothetical protein